MTIKIIDHAFDPYQEIQRYQNSTRDHLGAIGATSIFIGSMRDFNQGSQVTGMSIEHYPGMTEKQLELCVEKAQGLWSILDSLIVHRVGTITPNEVIVLIAVWSSHRGDAFDATRYIMEALKSTVPFWKKECIDADAERWVVSNTSGYQ
jgi:molybdopterin synthase catalytic subunit